MRNTEKMQLVEALDRAYPNAKTISVDFGAANSVLVSDMMQIRRPSGSGSVSVVVGE
jgi:hypothetical protein